MLFNLGGGGGIGSFLPAFILFFVINLIVQLFSGGLDDIFGLLMPMTEMTDTTGM